jgi:hypothetical protein
MCQPEAGFSQDVGGANAQPSARFYATWSEALLFAGRSERRNAQPNA